MPTTRSGSPPPLVVFTDLDGTLLSHERYDWSPAADALAELSRRRIPLVIASSKTRAEIEAWRCRLGVPDPFISENGGALYVPPDTVPRSIPGETPVAGYRCVIFGMQYPTLRAALRELAQALGVPLRGFGDMEPQEIGALTGLMGEELDRARQREFDEPFIPARPLLADERARLESMAVARGLRLTRGGRFDHLTGANSKGRAAQVLMSAWGAGHAPVVSLGVGDGPNDLELLDAVDRPIVVARPDGTHAPELRAGVPHARFTRQIGPAGFAEAVLEYLARPW